MFIIAKERIYKEVQEDNVVIQHNKIIKTELNKYKNIQHELMDTINNYHKIFTEEITTLRNYLKILSITDNTKAEKE